MEHVMSKTASEGELLTRISHELRTPLTSIIGYAEVMLSDPKLSPDLKREYVEIIRDAGQRLSNFLDNYFDDTFAEREKRPYVRSEEDLSMIIKWSIDLVAVEADAKSVTILAPEEDSIVLTDANTTHLVHVLQNILTNAIELAPVGGHIEILAFQSTASVEIRIINRDLGILNTSVNSVCHNFRWIQSPGVEISENGLGLAFAKHVVELEGGNLSVLTDHQQSLTFKLELPNRQTSTKAIT
jgi:signal transduction histidine kinase